MGQELLDARAEETAGKLGDLVDRLGSGSLSVSQFVDEMDTVLGAAHSQAVTIGRQAAGDTEGPEADDAGFAEAVMDDESEYLAAFGRDITSGRYTDAGGDLDTEAIGNRARQYTGKLAGTANEAWSLALPMGTPIYWVMTSENPCEDCPELESNSPYFAEDLPTYPGSCDTSCVFHCKCYLDTRDGNVGFHVPETVRGMADDPS